MKVKQNIISFLLGIAFTLTLGFTNVFEFTLSSDTLYVDGVRVDKSLYKYEGSNHLPVRATAEALGAQVEYTPGRIDITSKLTDIETVVKNCKDSCVMIYVYKDGRFIGNGSGWLYESPNGLQYVVTAKHVTDAGDRFTVYTDDAVNGITANEIVDLDTALDIAALKIKTTIPAVKLGNSDRLTEGERLVSITSPDGIQNSIDECLYTRTINVDKNYLQISESKMKGGSSGGAIFSYDSELVGMMIQGENTTQLAVPVNDIKPILKKLK